jgi:hypothetical protein
LNTGEIDPILLAELEQQNANMNKHEHKPKYRRCCGCTFGPKGEMGKFFGVMILNIILVVALFGLVIIDPDAQNVFAYGYALGCLVVAEQFCMMWIAFRDPGYINPSKHRGDSTQKTASFLKQFEASEEEKFFG